MPTLSMTEYSLITNVTSIAVAAMFAGALFFFFSRSQVAFRYRPALLITALVPAIACYHYYRIYDSFVAAYVLDGGQYVASGLAFNDAYRYADWILTVPLLIVELVAVLALEKKLANSLTSRLSIAALLMIALGYPGEIATDAAARWTWWTAAMIPFAYILYALYTEFSKAVSTQKESVQRLVGRARAIILLTWSFYPIAFLAPEFGLSGGQAEAFLQIGYTIADITAKVGMGLYIYFIALEKTEADSREQGNSTPAALAAA